MKSMAKLVRFWHELENQIQICKSAQARVEKAILKRLHNASADEDTSESVRNLLAKDQKEQNPKNRLN